jgi:site-specific DNA-methyltransferase (adenine-specific)
VPLASILLRQSSVPGELVVDPFAGSGAVGAAAVLAGRDFAGSDISPRAIEIATARLTAARPVA